MKRRWDATKKPRAQIAAEIVERDFRERISERQSDDGADCTDHRAFASDKKSKASARQPDGPQEGEL